MPKPEPYTAKSGQVTYRVRVRVGGKQTSETFASLRRAEAFCDRVARAGAETAVRELSKRDHASDDYMPTLREWYGTYMENATGITEGTRRDYEYRAGRVMLPLLGDTPLDLIDRAAVARFVQKLEKTPRVGNRGKAAGKPIGGTLSAKSISDHHGLLSALMKSAVIEGHIPTNPCLGTRLPRAGEHERDEARFLTHEEFWAIYTHLNADARALAVALVGSGMRWGEATALQVRHVDLDRKILRVRQTWKKGNGEGRTVGPPKSKKSRRDVAVPDQVVDVICPLIEGQPADAYVFRNGRGKPWQSGSFVTWHWRPACRAAGVDPPPRTHDLRHTAASWWLEAGMPLDVVQEQLGHESYETTRKIYAHIMPARREAAQRTATEAMTLGAPKQIGR